MSQLSFANTGNSQDNREREVCTFRIGTFSQNIVYVLKITWIFLTKFWHSDQRFSRNTFILLYLKFETHTHTSPDYSLIYTVYQFPGMVPTGNA